MRNQMPGWCVARKSFLLLVIKTHYERNTRKVNHQLHIGKPIRRPEMTILLTITFIPKAVASTNYCDQEN